MSVRAVRVMTRLVYKFFNYKFFLQGLMSYFTGSWYIAHTVGIW